MHLFKGTVQEFEEEQAQAAPVLGRRIPAVSGDLKSRVVYLCHDVHYYLDTWHPYYNKRNDSLNIAGGNFPFIPGKYKLPFRNGSFSVGAEGMITMKARGSDTIYNHKNLYVS